MKFLVKTSAILAFIATSSASAANLNIPMSFEYLALNGEPVATNMFTHKSKIELNEGTHKIAIRYHDMVEDDFSDSQSFIKSAPFIVTLKVDGDYQYQLTTADGSGTVKRPKQFAKKPQVSIVRKDSGSVNYAIELTDYKEESFITSLFNSNESADIDTVAAKATASNTQAAPAAKAAVSKPATIVAATAVSTEPVTSSKAPNHSSETSTINPSDQAEQMLQYWWLQADEKTRKEFMGWAIKQL